jgi:endonuclease/exonuclease/phosphatase family metal-dependent hydrolase
LEAIAMTADISLGPPYGELITSTVRVLTWNVWGRFGPWQAREAALINTLKVVRPDIVALQECWCTPDGNTQAARLGQALGYHHTNGGGTFFAEDWGTGAGLLSRWPIEAHEYREFPALRADSWGGSALFGCVDGPRGPLPVFSVGLDWPPHASAVRQASVGNLAAFVGQVARASFR